MTTFSLPDLRYFFYGGGSQAEMDFMQQAYDLGISAVDLLSGGGGGGTTIVVKDEGSITGPAVDTLNFVGSAVVATNVAGTGVITITGGAPSGTAGGSLQGSYPNPTLIPNAVTATELASNAVTSAKVFAAAITNAKLANSPTATVKGSVSGGVPADLTQLELTSLVNVFTTPLKGLVPAPGTSNTTDFLRRDGAWAAPPGGGGGGSADLITFAPVGTIAATDVQAAIAEVSQDITDLPTLTTSDTAKVPIATVAGVTTLNVANLATTAQIVGPSFRDDLFTITDDGDITKLVKFDASLIPTGTTQTFQLPDNSAASGILVTTVAQQTMIQKTLGGPIIQNSLLPLRGITFRVDTDPTFNDNSRGNPIEINGNVSVPARLAFLYHGAAAAGPPSATIQNATIGQVNARGYQVSGYAASPSCSINMIADELWTASAKGARMAFLAQPLGTNTNAVEGLRITSSAATDVVVRSGLAIGAGSAMAAPAADYGLEVKAGKIGYGVGIGGTASQSTSRTTDVTINKICGTMSLFAEAGSTTWKAFQVLNSTVAAGDLVYVWTITGANVYVAKVTQVVAGRFNVAISAVSGTANEGPVIGFEVRKISTS